VTSYRVRTNGGMSPMEEAGVSVYPGMNLMEVPR
jgi:hypothetical protein